MGTKQIIPTREQLLLRLDATNRKAVLWIIFQLVLISVGSCFVDWPAAFGSIWGPATVFAVILLEEVRPVVGLWAKRKIEIKNFKESTRFGEFDKHSLQSLYEDTLRKLGLTDRALPVYITAEQSLTGGAIRQGIFGRMRFLSGIYLHRQTLHRLNPEEVQSIIGHELGHYYRYYLKNEGLAISPLLLGGIGGILIVQQFELEQVPTFSILSIIFITYATSFINGMFWARTGETIEYLCDDHGAQVNGIYHSISCFLKLGVAAEIQCAIQKQAALAGLKGNVSIHGILETIERQLPYEVVSRGEVEKAIQLATRSQSKQQNNASLSGFLQYVRNSDQDESVQNQLETFVRQLTVLEKRPRVQWESALDDPLSVTVDEISTSKIIGLIEANPEALLFRSPAETGAVADIHPPLKNRILYLWYNRAAIESGRRPDNVN